MTLSKQDVQQAIFEVLHQETTTLPVPLMTNIADMVVSRLAARIIAPARPEYTFAGGIYQVTSGGAKVWGRPEIKVEVIAYTMQEARQKVIEMHGALGSGQQFFVDQITEVIS